MKNMKLILISLLVVSYAVPVMAVDFMIGAKAGYYLWEPFLKEVGGSGFSDIDKGKGMLYGPVASVIFTQDMSLSVAALTGEQSTHWSCHYAPYEDYYILGTYYFESRRTDVDAALSYRIIENLKIFAGYKYQYIKSTVNYTELRTDADRTINEINYQNVETEMPSHGPALGLGYSYPFAEKFFLAVNLSGLYMFSEFKMKFGIWENYNNTGAYNNNSSTETMSLDAKQTGINIEPAIGYSSGSDGLIFTLGLRYQWLRTEILDEPTPGEKIDPADDYLYGVFMSVVYAF